MSWTGIKCNPHKFGMHYLFPVEILKKKKKEEGVGSISSPVEKKQNVPMTTDSEDVKDAQPLECKKRMLPMFLHLPDQAMISGKDFNAILIVAFIGDPLVKKPRTWFSL
jgi:hypothetical protein